MVLISHEKKFIYIKNYKVGGTSCEVFFQKYCGLNNDSSEYISETITENGIIGLRGISNQNTIWKHHMTALEIKKNIGNKIFNNYFKFCVIRNPWDRIVSAYYWNIHKTKKFIDFERFIELNCTSQINYKSPDEKIFIVNKKILNDWYRYSIDNLPICDFYIKYDSYLEDI